MTGTKSIDVLIVYKKKEIMQRLLDFLRNKDPEEKKQIYKEIEQLEVELDELREQT